MGLAVLDGYFFRVGIDEKAESSQSPNFVARQFDLLARTDVAQARRK
jgi:hypothetical protein